ncbi:hypothetical protein O0I10_007693 [Lichtheimia ornata]|uniref:Uncharacterized protein n=1 Tax=Lichtheimia ornata TaxID=688661 RepID=A0AAD7XXM5_9FUNG|nr:uncharacterized protein O0I10_007693 [Lichtheimia ornata]KAJ8656616.1 hypothetical protein O0I10_007693 [Lichtheimia ornata]
MDENNAEDFSFDARTTSQQFQQRLLAAQQSSTERQIKESIESRNVDPQENNQVPLEEQRRLLSDQVKALEKEVAKLRYDLKIQRQRREKEASVVKMTPEQRAQLQDDEEQVDDPMDLDVIFDYLIRIASAPLPSNAADISTSDFIQSHAELRERAMQDPEVRSQIDFAHIEFTKASNKIEYADGPGTVRHCELCGSSYGQQFTVTFTIRQDQLCIENLKVEVGMETQFELCTLLKRIEEECNLLGFFRLLIHYGRLIDDRRTLFQRLHELYSSAITVEDIGSNTLKFYREQDHEIRLIWDINILSMDVSINICEQVIPNIRMEAYTTGSPEREELYTRIPANFARLVSMKGTFAATRIMLDAVFGLK